MAKSPKEIMAGRQQFIDEAEKIIDNHLTIGGSLHRSVIQIEINHANLNISKQEFDKFLIPKYKKVGWKKLKWIKDTQHGDYIEFENHLDSDL